MRYHWPKYNLKKGDATHIPGWSQTASLLVRDDEDVVETPIIPKDKYDIILVKNTKYKDVWYEVRVIRGSDGKSFPVSGKFIESIRPYFCSLGIGEFFVIESNGGSFIVGAETRSDIKKFIGQSRINIIIHALYPKVEEYLQSLDVISACYTYIYAKHELESMTNDNSKSIEEIKKCNDKLVRLNNKMDKVLEKSADAMNALENEFGIVLDPEQLEVDDD